MAQVWTTDDNKRLSELVVRFRFNFSRISTELGRDEESVRVHWTEMYLAKKHSRAVPSTSPMRTSQVAMLECPRIDFEPQRSSVLDTTGVDFTLQTSRSITGEVIHPSGFNIFKHSLKDVFTEIFSRMQSYLPTMDFPPASDPPEDTEPISYKITFKSGQPAIESRRGAKGKWQPSVPSIPQPNYDDINPIPEGDRPTKPPIQQVPMLLDSDEVVFRAVDAPLDLGAEYTRTEKELAKLFNMSETEVKKVQKKTAPTRFDTIKGRVRIEHTSDSDHDSEEEAAFLAEQRRARKQANPKPVPHTNPPTIPSFESDFPTIDPSSDSEDSENPANMAVPIPYSVIRQRELEDRAEAFRQLKLLEEQEKAQKTAFRRLAEAKKDQEELDRKVKIEEEENERLKVRREAKLQARLAEEISRKEQLMRAEAEIKKQLEEEQRKRTEERVKAGNSVYFFDPITSFEAPISGLPVSNHVKTIGIEDQPYILPLIFHFLSNSCVFGKANPSEEVSFQLVGLVRGVFGGSKSDLSYAPGAFARAIWFLAFDLDSSPIGFNAYLEGFPLAYIIPGGIPGKTFLKEIVIETESLNDRHLIVPIETIFTATPSFYPYNDCQSPDFEYSFAVLKPHSLPSKSQEMLESLCKQGKNKGLDLVGCRVVHMDREWREVYEGRFTKALGEVESVLVLCWYGYNPIEKLHDILGADTPELARRTDPESIRALYGESKERNCAYTAKLKQRVYKEICVWFGGRVTPSAPSLTLLQCPKVETAYFALSPLTSFKSLMSTIEKLLHFGFSLASITRLSAESTTHCGFLPTTRTVLKTLLRVELGWVISIQRPAAHSHLATVLDMGLEGKVMNEEEVSFLQAASGEYGNIEAMAGVGYILATPEAFIQTADIFPVAKIGEIISEHCEILSVKVVSGPFASDIEGDYSDTVQQTIAKSHSPADKDKLKSWLLSGPNLLFAYLPDCPEASKKLLSALKKTISNQGFSEYMKPTYLLVPRTGHTLLLPCELILDPLHAATALLYLPPSTHCTALDQHLTTVCVVKPDKSLTLFRQVLKFIYRHEFRIKQAHMHLLTPSLIDLLYSHQAESMDSPLNYEAFTAILQSGPCFSLKLTRQNNAIKKLKDIIGHPDPHLAEINTLRGSYGKSAEDNKLHCSLSYAHAKTEALRLFSGDEFLPYECEEMGEIEEKACIVGVLGENVLRICEEMKQMQLNLLDFRVSSLSESLLETYMLSFPDNTAFAHLLYRTEFAAVLVKGLSPSYRLTSLLQSLGLLADFHISTSLDSLHSLTSLFFPPYPY